MVTTQHLDDADCAAASARIGAGADEQPPSNGEHGELQRRDLLLAFIDRRRRLDRTAGQVTLRVA
jgi:hypothetical protein